MRILDNAQEKFRVHGAHSLKNMHAHAMSTSIELCAAPHCFSDAAAIIIIKKKNLSVMHASGCPSSSLAWLLPLIQFSAYSECSFKIIIQFH